jgi:hypothetical protein
MFLIFTHSRDANKFLANMHTAVVYQMLPLQTQITMRQIMWEEVGEAEEEADVVAEAGMEVVVEKEVGEAGHGVAEEDRANQAGGIRMPQGLVETTRRCRKQQDGRRRCTRVLSHFSSTVVHLSD